MTPKLITKPSEPAVSLEDLKAHVINSADAQDADLRVKLDAAITHVENELKRCLVTSTWEFCLESWPCGNYIEVPLGNLQSVESIKYTDSNGDEHTMDAGSYRLARVYTPENTTTDVQGGRIYLARGSSWPSAVLEAGEPIAIRFVCGWADAANVPVPIKQAILMLASHWNRNRDAVVVGNTAAVVSSELAIGVQRLTSMYEDRRY